MSGSSTESPAARCFSAPTPTVSRRASYKTANPSVIDLDSLRPPGLVYKDWLCTTKLFNLKCNANAVSRSGRFVGWFARNEYSIFETSGREPSLVCTGKFKKGHYSYGRTKPALKQFDKQKISDLSCAALSDVYIAIGTSGIGASGALLVFSIQGERPGKWLCLGDVGAAGIERLTFSPDGEELFALLMTNDGHQKAIVYSTSEFARDPRVSDDVVPRLSSVKAVTEWKNSICEIPATVFSDDGGMIAICTSHDNNGRSQVRLLKKDLKKGWRRCGEPIPLVVLRTNDSSPGMTGISL